MSENQTNLSGNREKTIIRTSFIGIGVNALLAAFKAVIGLASHSISITLDAVNNLSDALSSVITILGTKLAGKLPDKKHPYGYGRIEYLTSTLISVLVLYAGLTSLVESVKKIIHPELPDYSVVSLVIVAAAVVTKILLGSFVKATGKKVESDSLVNSGQDALLDSVLSGATLVAALIYVGFGLSLEAYLGTIISIVIIKSGIEMLSESLSRVLGERADSDLSRNIKQDLCSFDGVYGAYDLFMHDYGPDRMQASIHVEVPDIMTAKEIDVLTRKMQHAIYDKYHVILTAVGVYSHNTGNDEAAQIQQDVRHLVANQPYVLQMHGFYLDIEKETMRFDVVIDFAAPDRHAVYADVCQKVKEAYPSYQVVIALDTDTSD